jgi:2,3-bisphosphoglycerate-independent phosphoglycerate mutase
MVGHTGNMRATVEALETVDRCLGELLGVIQDLEGIAAVNADHGNADVMFTMDGNGRKTPKTAHTLNPVPFAVFDPFYGNEYHMAHLEKAGLSNVAATLVNLLGYEKPHDYDPSLIEINAAR